MVSIVIRTVYYQMHTDYMYFILTVLCYKVHTNPGLFFPGQHSPPGPLKTPNWRNEKSEPTRVSFFQLISNRLQ